MKKLNRYTLYARYFPGLITIIPATLIYFFLTRHYSDFALDEYFKSTAFVFGVSGTFVLTYFLSNLVRELGCFLERKYFISKQGFPTTYLMLYSDPKFPKQIKASYGRKIRNDFQLVRPTQHEEGVDPAETIKILAMASKYLATRYQQHEQIKDANVAHGFSRNVSGGLFISIPTAIAGVILGWQLGEVSLMLWSGVCLIAFGLIACVHKAWIRVNAEKYAEKVFAMYLGIRSTEAYDQ